MHKRLELKRAGGPEAADPFLTTPLHPNGSVLSVSDMLAEYEKYTSENCRNTYEASDPFLARALYKMYNIHTIFSFRSTS